MVPFASNAATTDNALPAFDCVINPNQVVDISSPVPGVVEALYVERSDYVEKGQIVARLAAGVEEASVELARARANLDPEISVGELNVEYDQKRKSRIESLYGKKVVSIEDLDDAAKEAMISEWRLQQAKDLQDVRALELKRAEALLAQKTIRSTISGFVVQRFKSQGEYVEDQAIVRIAQLDPLRVEAIIPMNLFGKVAPGMTAKVYAEASGSEYDAEVTIVDPVGDPGSATFGIRLTMANPDFSIQGGTRCEFKFTSSATAQHKPAASINRNTDIAETTLPGAATTASHLTNTVSEQINYRLGPFQHLDAGRAQQQLLAEADIHSTLVELARNKTGHLVLAITDDIKVTTEKLIQAGIDDFVLRKQPPYAGRLSLGYFSKTENANTLSEQLKTAGIATEIQPMTRSISQFWLHVQPSTTTSEEMLQHYATNGVNLVRGIEDS